MRCAIVHYHELALKGRNRNFFERQLIGNIRSALKDLGTVRIESLRGRLRLVLPEQLGDQTVKERLSAVFGIANFSLADGVPLNLLKPDLERLTHGVGAAVLQRTFDTFRVTAKRADKRLTLTSMDVEKVVGKYLCDLTGKAVKLTAPDLTVYIELLAKDAYYYLDKIQGPGGMPVGVSGTVACLISGGIDSPVAAYRMMKRGCRVDFVHFHSYPFLDRTSQQKARQLARRLTRHQYAARLFLVPFGDTQQQIVGVAPAPYRVVLYRRYMLRMALALAQQTGAEALVTGESLGQVASQTLQNLRVIEAASDLPVLRPLIGMDKAEIMQTAADIGTYPISIQPDQDCCTLFVPRHPATRTTLADIEAAEQALDTPALVQMALDGVQTVELYFPDAKAPGATAGEA